MGIACYELGVADSGGGVDDGVHGGEAMVEAGCGGSESNGLIERDNFLVHGLGDEAVGDGLAAEFGELFVDLVEDNRGN